MASQAAELKMPQSGNVQREPSMEEILASIRRIIEDSDQARTPEPGSERRALGGGTPVADVEAFRGEFGGTDHAEPSLRGSFDDESAAASSTSPAPLAGETGSVQPGMEMDEVLSATGDPTSSATAEQPAVPQPESAQEAAAMEEEIDLADDLLADVEEEASIPPLAANSGAERDGIGQSPDKPSIISEHTGRQVAAAFGELSQAFMASRQRSFDDMAAEMMRPMLQEWLDNNLPTIVEKLVREEIERVARGS